MCPHCSNYVGLKTWKKHKKLDASYPSKNSIYNAFRQICPGCKLDRTVCGHLYTRKEMKSCVLKHFKAKNPLQEQQPRAPSIRIRTDVIVTKSPIAKMMTTNFPISRNGLVFDKGAGQLMIRYMKEY